MNTFNTTGFRCNVSKELRVIVIRSLGPTKNVKKKKGKRNVSRSFQYKRSWRERTGGGNKTESEEVAQTRLWHIIHQIFKGEDNCND